MRSVSVSVGLLAMTLAMINSSCRKASHVIFAEDFEEYPVGALPNSSEWDVIEVDPPSEMLVVSSGYSGNGLLFLDPTSDTADQSHAWVYTSLPDSYSTVRFRVRANPPRMCWGIRAAHDWQNYVPTISWWLTFWGESAYCRTASGWVEVVRIDRGRWYEFRLQLDWQRNSYDVFVSDSLAASSAFYSGSPSGVLLHLLDYDDSGRELDTLIVDDIEVR